jgi:tetraacyldisaccharide 4'-kinase
MAFPEGARVVTVGGATLGGSGKTPLALACAELLAQRGRVAIVGHAYRAKPDRARVVSPDDPLALVGDEALACARFAEHHALAVDVVVAPSRQEALDLALQCAEVAIVDGVLQTAPRRASLALLAVDPERPWGSGACPPRGDLRAPVHALLAHADLVVPVAAEIAPSRALAGLRAARLGLFTALARPERVIAALARAGISPALVVSAADHAPSPRSLARAAAATRHERLDAWLATSKCASHLGAEIGGMPVITLTPATRLPNAVAAILCAHVVPGGYGPGRPTAKGAHLDRPSPRP